MSLGRVSWVRRWVSASVSSGSPSAAATNPAIRRRAGRPRVRVRARVPRLTCSWVTRWTSIGPVAVELLVDLVGHPEQGELAQGGEVADAEVVAECGVDLVRPVDVPVGH